MEQKAENQPDELLQAREQMDAKLKRKQELFAKLNGFGASLDALHQQFDALRPQLKGTGSGSSSRLHEKAEKIEFKIATEAHTPAQERDMLKELKVVQEQLSKLKAESLVFSKADGLRTQIRDISRQRADAKAELDGLRAELETIYQKIIKLGAARAQQFNERKERREQARQRDDYRSSKRKQMDEERAEMAPYLKESHDPHVSLEEIVEIKKKSNSSS